MPRVKRGVTSRAKHKKVFEFTKGHRGRRKNVYRVATQSMDKALQYAYRDRRNKKRDFRGLWIQRINAGVREHGLTYAKLIDGMGQGLEGWLFPVFLNPARCASPVLQGHSDM